jgi:hypothetical protein
LHEDFLSFILLLLGGNSFDFNFKATALTISQRLRLMLAATRRPPHKSTISFSKSILDFSLNHTQKSNKNLVNIVNFRIYNFDKIAQGRTRQSDTGCFVFFRIWFLSLSTILLLGNKVVLSPRLKTFLIQHIRVSGCEKRSCKGGNMKKSAIMLVGILMIIFH